MNIKTIEFIKKAQKIHNHKYDYSLVEYINCDTKVKIICPIHGEFEQIPYSHLKGFNCLECGRKISNGKHRLSNKDFINKAKLKHGDKYDYSLVEYITKKTKVTIICPIHGEFDQTPDKHLNGQGCYRCSKVRDTHDFIIKAAQIHNNLFDYSKVNYVNAHSKVTIICPIHGEFEQNPHNHLRGTSCPICKESKGEKIIRHILDKHEIKFISQHSFHDCKYKNPLEFDFYLPDYNICIEYNGLQHYQSVEFFGGEKEFILSQKRDKIKIKYCDDNNIPLIIIKYTDNIKNVLKKVLMDY